MILVSATFRRRCLSFETAESNEKWLTVWTSVDNWQSIGPSPSSTVVLVWFLQGRCEWAENNMIRLSISKHMRDQISEGYIIIYVLKAKMASGQGSHCAYRESNNVHLLITRPPKICVNLLKI